MACQSGTLGAGNSGDLGPACVVPKHLDWVLGRPYPQHAKQQSGSWLNRILVELDRPHQMYAKSVVWRAQVWASGDLGTLHPQHAKVLLWKLAASASLEVSGLVGRPGLRGI